MGKISAISAKFDPELLSGGERTGINFFSSNYTLNKQVELQQVKRSIVGIPNDLTMEAVDINPSKAVYNQNPL